MTTQPVLDLDNLLAPISAERPTGAYLRGDDDNRQLDARAVALFHDLRSEYTRARNAERNLEKVRGLPKDDPAAQVEPPDWGSVKEMATVLLAEHSKDLWSAARLIEAAFRTDGFAGLRDALHVARRLCEDYWEDLYPPRSEQTGYEDRIADLVGQLLANDKLLRLPILQAPLTEHKSFNVLDYQAACELEALKAKDIEAFEKRKNQGDITLADFEADVKDTDPEFFRHSAAVVQECIAELDSLAEVLEAKCEADSPSVTLPSISGVLTALETCEQAIRAIAPGAFQESAASSPTDGRQNADADVHGSVPSSGGARQAAPGAITTREQAFQVLEQIAQFFEKTEPQSFIPYSLRQIVRRGGMSLPELLNELIAADDARREFSRLTGVPQAEQQSY